MKLPVEFWRIAISFTVSLFTLFVLLLLEHKIEERSHMCTYSFVIGFLAGALVMIINLAF